MVDPLEVVGDALPVRRQREPGAGRLVAPLADGVVARVRDATRIVTHCAVESPCGAALGHETPDDAVEAAKDGPLRRPRRVRAAVIGPC